MDYNERYFFCTVNFNPDYGNDFIHVEGDQYRHIATGDLYRKRLLLDHGWGPESGYERLPALPFDELICLVTFRHHWSPLCLFSRKAREQKRLYMDNYWGAVAVIMQDHTEELVQFLDKKRDTDFFEDPYLRKQFQQFFGLAGTKPTYEQIKASRFGKKLMRYDTWNRISEKVIALIYK